MGFEEEYQNFMNAHMQARIGERLRRLQEGHKQAEMFFEASVVAVILPFPLSSSRI